MTQTSPNTGKINLLPHVLQFCGTYVLCLVAIIIITTLLNFEIPSAMGIIALIAALSAPVVSFVKKSGRAFSTGERVRFATGVSLALIAINLILVLGQKLAGIGPDVFNELARALASEGISVPVVIAGLVVFSFLLSWVVTYFFSGFMSRQQAKQRNKAKA
jgi:small-conductance mechanosensitive channel